MFISNSNKKLIHMKKIKSVLFLLFIVVPSIMYGQVVLTNPGIPEKETFIYKQIIDGKYEFIEILFENKKNDSKSWLEYRFYSDVKEVLVKLNSDNLTAFYSEVWETQEGRASSIKLMKS